MTRKMLKKLSDAYRPVLENLENRTLFSVSTPFTGTPAPVPGAVISAANYDKGGPNVAYFTPDPVNHTGTYRPTDEISIQNSDEGAYNIAYTQPGEWLNYTVNVTTAGNYSIAVRAASPSKCNRRIKRA